MTALLKSEGHPATRAGSPGSAETAGQETNQNECLHTRRYSYLLPAQPLLRGATPPAASSNCPVWAASCLMSSLIQIALAARSAASVIRTRACLCILVHARGRQKK